MPSESTSAKFPFPGIAMPFGGKATVGKSPSHLAGIAFFVAMFVAAVVVDMRLHRLFWTWIASLTILVIPLAAFAYSLLRMRIRMTHRATDPSFRATVERLSEYTVKGPGTVEFTSGPVVVFSPTVLTFRTGAKTLTIKAQKLALKGRPRKPTFVLRFESWDPPFATEQLSHTERHEAIQFINAAFSTLVARRPWLQESKLKSD
jgi:hypothetical protein